MGKVRAMFDRDNRSPRSGERVKKLQKHFESLEKKQKQGKVDEKWVKDAKAKALARAKRYGVKLEG